MVKFWRYKVYLNVLNRLKPEYFSFLFYQYHKLFYKSLIFRGRKIWASNFFIKVKYILKKKVSYTPSILFLMSLINITPNVILMRLKLGSKVEFVGLPINKKKRLVFGVKWALKLLKNTSKLLTVESVANNLISSLSGKGISIEEKKKVYKIATDNRYLLKFFK